MNQGYHQVEEEKVFGTVGLLYNNVLHINIKTDGREITPPLKKVAEYIFSQHPNAPLSIEMFDWDKSPVTFNDEAGRYLQYHDDKIWAKLAAYLDLFYSVIHRWQEVRLDAELISVIEIYTNTRFPSAGPTTLKSIAISNAIAASRDSTRVKTHSPQFMSSLWSRNAQSFSHFSFEQRDVLFTKTIYPDLPYSLLTQLEVRYSKVMASTVHDILEQAFAIEKCIITNLIGPGPTARRQAARATNLEYLELKNDAFTFDDTGMAGGAVFLLLNSLIAPSLTELRLETKGWNSWVWTEFHKKSRFQLEILHLTELAIMTHDLTSILEVIPTIQELLLHGERFIDWPRTGNAGDDIPLTHDVLRRLFFDPEGGYLCPDLVSLTVDIRLVETYSGTFRRMLRDRFRKSSLRQVKIINAAQLPNKERKTLEDLATSGLSVWLEGRMLASPAYPQYRLQ